MGIEGKYVVRVADALREARDAVVDSDWHRDYRGAERARLEVRLLERAEEEGVEFYPLF